MMTSNSNRRDNTKLQNERHQLIIQELLRDEDNKYCADCDAKGPRWASWNIGIFLCIRCAGIHRNLGVHISKVKSVNLDTWTPMQLAVMREMGNSRARAVYEANLPDNFRRPQTDSALETFIRAKYEQKRYIAQEYTPIKPDVESLMKELQRLELSLKKKSTSVSLGPHLQQPATKTYRSNKESSVTSSEINNDFDLLGLDCTSSPVNKSGLFEKVSHNQANCESRQQQPTIAKQQSVSSHVDTSQHKEQSKDTTSSLTSDLLGLDFGCTSLVTEKPANVGNDGQASSVPLTKITKDSILALYQHGTSQSGGLGCSSYSKIVGQFPTFSLSGGQYFVCNSPVNNPMHINSINSLGDGHTKESNFSLNQFPSHGMGMNPVEAKSLNGPSPFIPSSNFAVWPENNTSTYSPAAAQPTQNVVIPNQFGSFVSTIPLNCNPNNPCTNTLTQSWNMNQTLPNQTFGNFVSHSANNIVRNNEMYLSQVKGQLTSLYLGQSSLNP
ncbi:hypothetical protein MN116_002156 [Schistosoma mekongi]|uniref:Arf-GAP domain-containing protein n=1 Tax=Schistosoma mekongi TaxID=38744 RepID=A0AAE2D8K1_SCHME|nr:hypothetical protein MN116_002156 [Schistosoma mekongi]